MHNLFLRLSVYVAVMLLVALTCVTDAHAGELIMDCVDGAGTPVKVKKAELLLSGWGYTSSMELHHEGGSVVMPLDADGLKSIAGTGFGDPDKPYTYDEAFAYIDEAFIYIEADGYAPACSGAFRFPGNSGVSPGYTVVLLPGGATVKVKDGEGMHATVAFRRPERRSLLLMDESGPVSGVTVSTYMYWSSSNHCARLTGARLLGMSVSGGDGVVDVPDGDIVYAFEIAADDMGLVLADPELPEYPERLVTTLADEKTVVKLHRRKKVALTMRVTKNGVPVPDETLYGCMADCPGGVCASCCGPLSTTDAYGVISIPGFYPEAYTSIYIQSADGDKIFEADPRKLKLDGPIGVDLAFCASPGGG